jgi:hypothetical protein
VRTRAGVCRARCVQLTPPAASNATTPHK